MPRVAKRATLPFTVTLRDDRPLSLHWDSFRSWIDPAASSHWLFTAQHDDQNVSEPLDEAVASCYWRGYFVDGATFLFSRYGVMLECAPHRACALLHGVQATFCASRELFSFPNPNARWMFAGDFCEVGGLKRDACPPQGMNLVGDTTSSGLPLAIPPYLGFGVRLDFAPAVLDLQRAGERFKITYLMWGSLGEPNPIPR